MGRKTITAWLAVLAMAMALFSSCESGGNYRVVDYRFGVGARWSEYHGAAPFGLHPGASEAADPAAAPLPGLGRPDLDGGDLGGFD
jgi:hypothetical protein